MIKAILLVLFIGLLLVGCEKDPEGSTLQSNHPTVKTPYLEDPATLDRFFVDAMDMLKADRRENKGGILLYEPGEQTPYTGWVKFPADDETRMLGQFKDGKPYGLWIMWNKKNGQKLRQMSLKDNKEDGVAKEWYENGQKRSQEDWKAGKFMGCEVWKPNGERCRHTNLNDGDGVVLTYNENGRNDWMVTFSTYKDGEWVSRSDPQPIKVKSAEDMTEDIDDLLEELEERSSKPDNGLGSETLDPIIADAIDFDSLKMDGGLFFDPKKEAKYTGWAKWEWSNGQVKYLVRLEDGKQDGPNIWWYKNGHKRSEHNWKANRQDGLSITYNEDGTQRERTTWEDGKLMTAVAWKPGGEECPATNVLKGNGIVVRYNKDGSQKTRFTYRDGELVSQTPIEEKSLSERIENIEVDDLLEVLGKNSNTYDIDALLGEAEKLSSSQDEDAVALQDQRPPVALDSQRQVSPSPAQSASLPPGSTSSTEIRTLAKNYYFGRESALDYERAFALFAQLANSGDAEATRYLGIAYLRGKGVSKDRVKALQWFRVASQRGDALAAKNVRMLEGLGLDDSAITDPIESPKVIDLDDKETRDKIIAEAIDLTFLGDGLRKRSKDGEELWYAPNKTTPYSGWQKQIYVNGRVGSLTEYKFGRLDGQNVFWNEGGLKVQKYNWKEGKMHGLYTNWYKNGRKKEEGNYKDGKRDGLWTTWFEGGKKEKEKTFRDGILTDTFAWLPNGERCPFTNLKNGDGVVVHYYPNGQKWFKLNYKNYETFEPDGISISWYANGQKVGEENRENGELDGLGTSWYESGQKRSEANYKDGKVLSVQVWKPDGEECPLTNLKDGNGFLIWYDDDGTESSRTTYKNGERVN